MAEHLRLRSGPLHAVLAPAAGGSIARLDWLGEGARLPVLRGADAPASPLEAGCFPLVPYCNRIRDGRFHFRGREVRLAPNMAGDPSPLHGHGWLAAWEVVEASAASAVLGYRHAPDAWPWAYEAHQHIALADDRLEAALSCTNRSDDDMPCGLGFHPYFPCTAGARLTTRVVNVWTVDEHVLPVDRRAATGRYALDGRAVCGRDLDNGYDGWGGSARIEAGQLPFAIEMSSREAGFFQLYSPPNGALFVAEPVSHANAALNAPEEAWPALGLRVLKPGETMRLTMALTLRPKPARA